MRGATPVSEVVVIRCPMVAHPQLGAPRVPLKLAGRPNLKNEREKDGLVFEFLKAYAELHRVHGGPVLPTGVDPDWILREVPSEQGDVNAGATICLELSRDTPIVIPDPGKDHGARVFASIPALPGEVPSGGVPVPQQPGPPVLPPGAVPPASQAPPAAPDIRPAACGGTKCAIVNGVEMHETTTCPQAGGQG